MQWNGASSPQGPERRPALRGVLDMLQERARPFVERQPDFARPAYGSVLQSGADMLPGVGDVVAVEDLQTAAQNNDWGGIGLGLLSAIPGIPAIGKGGRRGARASRQAIGLMDAAPSPVGLMGRSEADDALARYRAVNPEDTGARVLNPGDEGYPTNAQWDEASQAYVAPRADAAPARAARAERAPSLRPAMKGTDGKIYTADDNHFTAMAQMPENVRRATGLNDSYRGFVDDRGRYLNRARAQEYALNFGLLRDDAPSWARNNHELVSEYLRPYEPPAPIAPVEPDYPIRAYHGSPHSFDQFSLDKIGTGEGAQSYGHGLYFAESEDVARSYRDTLSTSINDGAQRRLEREGGNLDAAIAKAREMSERYRAGGAESYARAVEEDLRGLERYQQTGDWTPGSMYEVGIDADPQSFMDWDAPIYRQPEPVRNVLREYGYDAPAAPEPISDPALRRIVDEALRRGESPHDVGLMVDNEYDLYQQAQAYAQQRGAGEVDGYGDFVEQEAADYLSALRMREEQNAGWAYNMAARDVPRAIPGGPAMPTQRAPEISARLQEVGVPGIRYLDGGSRSAGEGSSNYVVFNDALIKVLRKYGISGLGLGLGASAVANQNQTQPTGL